MNRIQTVAVTVLMLLLPASCDKGTTETMQTAREDWMPSVTRAEGNGENGFKEDIRISAVAELDDLTSTAFSDVFLMEEKRWEGNTHSWGINTALHLIATSPTDYNGEAIPTIVKNGDKDALMAGYRYCGSKPASVAFTMSHLMGQLRVHIQVAGNADGTPTDAEITLRKCSAVNYTSSPSVSLSDETEAFPLGAFAKQENEEAGNYVNTTQTIIPQTLAKGIRCLSFKIDNTRYAFTPDKDIALAAGKKTHLYLGIAYDKKVISVGEGVSVDDWGSGTDIGGGEARE